VDFTSQKQQDLSRSVQRREDKRMKNILENIDIFEYCGLSPQSKADELETFMKVQTPRLDHHLVDIQG